MNIKNLTRGHKTLNLMLAVLSCFVLATTGCVPSSKSGSASEATGSDNRTGAGPFSGLSNTTGSKLVGVWRNDEVKLSFEFRKDMTFRVSDQVGRWKVGRTTENGYVLELRDDAAPNEVFGWTIEFQGEDRIKILNYNVLSNDLVWTRIKESGQNPSSAPAGSKPGAEPKASAKVYRTGQELLAEMPKDAYPKYGADFAIERSRAQTWCKANLLGRALEWSATVKGQPAIRGKGPFEATLNLEEEGTGTTTVSNFHGIFFFGEPFPLGDQLCQVGVSLPDNLRNWNRGAGYVAPILFYPSCTETEADALRKMTQKKLTLRATVTDVEIDNAKVRTMNTLDRLAIRVIPSTPTLEGLPAAARTAKLGE